ncbi:MAG: class I SAM-dependent methyltransferase, partial [Candidatus Eisenbacteria bacterium]
PRLAHLANRFGYRSEPALPAWLGWTLALVPGRREHLEWSVLELRSEWRGPLLDVGCGSGGTLRLMRELGWDAEGIDLDPQAIAVANHAGLRARVGTFESSELPERHYAAVTSIHVIEHVDDPAAFLRHCRRVLRPGGRVALTTPNAASLGSRVFGSRWRGLEPPRHFQVFTAAGLAHLAREAGFESVRVRTSARLAAAIVRESLQPGLATGTQARSAGPPLRVLASAFQMAERALLPFWREAGEELLLSAQAPGGRA